MSEPTFFARPAELRAWFVAHHQTSPELWVGFHKKGSGTPSITWPEAVDEALCFGWIDGIRKSVDDAAYMIRFTPRKRTSTWSAVNIARVAELMRAGRMRPAGLAAFEARKDEKSGIYSYEQRHVASLDDELEREFRANEHAWTFFEGQAPHYRRTAIWWVVSAKKDETRRRRLAALVEHSAQGERIPQLRRPGKTEERS